MSPLELSEEALRNESWTIRSVKSTSFFPPKQPPSYEQRKGSKREVPFLRGRLDAGKGRPLSNA